MIFETNEIVITFSENFNNMKEKKKKEFIKFTAESNNSQTLDDVKVDSKLININNAFADLWVMGIRPNHAMSW